MRLFINYVWSWYRLLESVILSKGSNFIAELIKEFNKILNIETKLYIAFYSQIDKKRARVVLENVYWCHSVLRHQ